MDNQNGWNGEDLAGRVRSTVNDMLNSLETEQLARTVRETVGVTLDDVRRKVGDARWRRQTGAETVYPERKPFEIRVNWKGKAAGILMTVFGSIGTGIFGLLTIALLAAVATWVRNPVGWWVSGISGIIAAGFGVMLWNGISRNNRLARLRQYVKELKLREKPYCEIAELSRSCGRRLGFVKKDLRRMIGLGMLPDARMDEEGNWLLLDQETWEQYQLSRRAMEQRQEEETLGKGKQEKETLWKAKREKETGQRQAAEGNRQKGQKQQKDEAREGTKAEKGKQSESDSHRQEEGWTPESMIRQGEEYRRTLAGLREAMPQDPVRDKLLRLDKVLDLLFQALKKHPEQLDQLEKLMDYYLPTTVKLVDTYHEFACVEVPGESMKEAMAEIRETLDTMNRGFENMLDDMYRDTAFDAVTDAAALQAMLARHGMTDTDFS